MNTTNCPYCNDRLKEIPSRKKKCPNCGKYIFVRNGELVTEEQATIVDWIKRLENLGLTQKEFDFHRKALTKQFGKTSSINDTIWRFFNSQLAKAPSYPQSKFIFIEMARLVRIEGKDSKPYLAEAAKIELLQFKKMGVTKVRVFNCNDNLVCPKCRELEKRTLTIEEALEYMPIPHLCQNEDGCRCWYSPV